MNLVNQMLLIFQWLCHHGNCRILKHHFLLLVLLVNCYHQLKQILVNLNLYVMLFILMFNKPQLMYGIYFMKFHEHDN